MQASVSKGEFAALIGVSPGRVSQYLAEGKITAAALEGVGRNARIIVEQAKSDLRLTLDVGQRLGNGIDTRLDPSAPITAPAQGTAIGERPSGFVDAGGTIPSAAAGTLTSSGIDYQIKQEKLEQARRANRNAAINDARDRGQLIETEASRAEMTRVAAALMDVFDGGLNDMASAVAAAFQLPQRDVKHLMRREFRKLREKAAEQMRKKAIELPAYASAVVEAEDLEATDLA
jgi:predicted XRE-type DNA-binding protein